MDDKDDISNFFSRESTSTEKSIVCPQCNKDLPTDSVFCHYCGTPIDDGSSAQSIPRVEIPKCNPVSTHCIANTHSASNINYECLARKKRLNKVVITIIIVCLITFATIFGAVIGVPEYKYNQACTYLDNDVYSRAIEMFKELGGYKDSERKINEAKYEYVLNNIDRNNATTYEYLSELRRIDYKNTSYLYDMLFGWKATCFAINTSADDELTSKDDVSKYDTIYFHIRVTGGKPNELLRLKVVDVSPDGTSEEYIFDRVSEDGDILWYSWSYSYPQYGATGTLKCKFYDGNDNLIGSASVRLTD